MHTILGREQEEVQGLSKPCNQCNQLCDQCNQLCVVSAMDYGKCSLNNCDFCDTLETYSSLHLYQRKQITLTIARDTLQMLFMIL